METGILDVILAYGSADGSRDRLERRDRSGLCLVSVGLTGEDLADRVLHDEAEVAELEKALRSQ